MLSIYDISSDLCKIALSGMREFCPYGKVGSLARKFITQKEEEKEKNKVRKCKSNDKQIILEIHSNT